MNISPVLAVGTAGERVLEDFEFVSPPVRSGTLLQKGLDLDSEPLDFLHLNRPFHITTPHCSWEFYQIMPVAETIRAGLGNAP